MTSDESVEAALDYYAKEQAGALVNMDILIDQGHTLCAEVRRLRAESYNAKISTIRGLAGEVGEMLRESLNADVARLQAQVASLSQTIEAQSREIADLTLALEQVQNNDKTEYDYRSAGPKMAKNRNGLWPESGKRWATPREIAKDALLTLRSSKPVDAEKK